MIKHSLILFCALLVLTGCSTYNRIQSYGENGVRIINLFQLPSVSSTTAKETLTINYPLKINMNYLYAQRDKSAPLVTLGYKTDHSTDVLPDSLFLISLDQEAVQLPALEGRYIVPENLWVPVIYAKEIGYHLKDRQKEVVVRLNTRERNKVIEFFKRAIKYRDQVIPLIPEGQKKW